MTERWQDYDCPDSGIDFDLGDGRVEPMVYDGESFHCSGCGSSHVATDDLITQYEIGEDGVFRIVPLQRREG